MSKSIAYHADNLYGKQLEIFMNKSRKANLKSLYIKIKIVQFILEMNVFGKKLTAC